MALTGLSILLAEDNPTNQMVATQMLECLGARVTLAVDGADALEKLDRERFDVGLIDIEMPRVSGLELIRIVRARDDDLARMPLIALTAYVMREHMAAITEAGADGIIPKPILSIDGFGQDILGHVRARRIRDADYSDAGTRTGDAEDGEAPIDRAVLDTLLQALGAEVKPEFLRRVIGDVSAARAKIASAHATKDWPELCAATHILISIGGSIGAHNLHELARCLNSAGHVPDVATIDRDVPVILDVIDRVLAVVEREAEEA